jgi:hypothetical protein
MSFEKLTDKQIVRNVEIVMENWNKHAKVSPDNKKLQDDASLIVANLLCILTTNLEEDKEALK